MLVINLTEEYILLIPDKRVINSPLEYILLIKDICVIHIYVINLTM